MQCLSEFFNPSFTSLTIFTLFDYAVYSYNAVSTILYLECLSNFPLHDHLKHSPPWYPTQFLTRLHVHLRLFKHPPNRPTRHSGHGFSSRQHR